MWPSEWDIGGELAELLPVIGETGEAEVGFEIGLGGGAVGVGDEVEDAIGGEVLLLNRVELGEEEVVAFEVGVELLGGEVVTAVSG